MLCTKYPMTREALRRVPITQRDPATTSDSWAGIQHGALADALIQTVQSRGMATETERWGVSKDQSCMYGSFDVRVPPRMVVQGADGAAIVIPELHGMAYSLGVRHSNAGKYAVTVSVGARVFVCDNGAMTGEFAMKHKHTIGLRLDEFAAAAINQYLRMVPGVAQYFEQMRDIKVPDADAAWLLLRAPRTGVFAWQHLQRADTAWNVPEHEEFEPRNLWSLYNAFTSAIRGCAITHQQSSLAMLKDRVIDPYINYRLTADGIVPVNANLYGEVSDAFELAVD